MAVPVQFLDQENAGQPATVTSDTQWTTILQNSGFSKDVSTQGNGNVAMKLGDDLWDLQFSSVGNKTYFDLDPSLEKPLNPAWMGDEFNSAVMVLSDTQGTADIFSRDIPLSQGDGSVWDAFNVSSESNKQLEDFLTIIDSEAGNPLTVKLQKPTTPRNPNPSALWCTATAEGYRTAVRLEYALSINGAPTDSPLEKAIHWINSTLGLSVKLNFGSKLPDLLITCTKTTTYSLADLAQQDSWKVSFQFEMSNFKFALDFSKTGNAFYLIPTTSSTALFNEISDIGLDAGQIPDEKNSHIQDLIGEHLNMWYVKIEMDISKDPPKLSYGVGVLACLTIGPKHDSSVIIGFTYDSQTKGFKGRLILKDDPIISHVRYLDYDYRIELSHEVLLQSFNVDTTNIQKAINLWTLFSDGGTPPSELASFKLAAAEVTYQSISDDAQKTGGTLSFFLNINGSGPSAPASSDTAPSGFTWGEITVSASRTALTTKSTNITIKSIAIDIKSTVGLIPNDPSITPATLMVELFYKSSTGSEDPEEDGSDWILQGSVSNLSVMLLANLFFDVSCSSGAMAVLGNLTLTKLDVFYTYSSGKASSFLIQGIIALGKLQLDLSYQYVSKSHKNLDKPNEKKKTAAQLKWEKDGPPNPELKTIEPDPTANNWSFEAFLRLDSPKSTIADIANSIVPGNVELPGFVGSIEVAATGDPLNAPIKLIYTGTDLKGSILAVWVNIGPFNMTFIQFRPKATDENKKPGVKQILRISADQIPLLDKVPLVNQLPQPFDHLVYLWVNDPDNLDANKKGFTREMIDKEIGLDSSINHVLAEINIPELQFKDSRHSSTPETDIVFVSGHHFVVVTDSKVVLDHVFTPDPEPAAGTTPASGKTPAATVVDTGKVTPSVTPVPLPAPAQPVVTGPESPPTKGDSNNKAGPLTISALTVQYKNGSLFVGVDATLVLGPITFSVIGFTLEIKISQVKLNDLAALITDGLVSVSIHGLEAGLEKEPLTLKGVFIHDVVPDATGDIITESYRGGIAVGFKAWKVLAVGEYAIVSTKSTNSEFKSVFVYGKLDGPLVTLEFATISGVRLGFGYNSLVHLPTADKLYQFPFISDAATGDDPLAVLNAMEGGTPPFVYKKLGGIWFAAGMTITCFDCISLTAVLMFEIETKSDQNGVIIALLADGVFQMEPLAPPDFSLFYVELLIKVELNFIEGYIAADAALAPASHVYVPSAHLTGSGSFYTWFSPSAHAGDWVVTIGGYHRAYNPPAHYPQNLTRLGLNFIVGNAVHVVGQAYVAVTPKCAMAGGSLHISVDVGPVSAYADIALDVFINFKPFYFIAEIRLSVGVDCDVDLLFVSFHVSISLSADLTLWGPDSFGGTAYVDFWFFGFSIDFGAGLRDPPGISLIEFYDIVRTAGPNSEPPQGDTTSTVNPYQAQHKYSIEDGIFPDKPKSTATGGFPNTGATIDWKVLAGPLQIRIDCDFALSNAYLTTTEGDVPIQPEIVLNTIYSFPMHNHEAIESKLWVSVYKLDPEKGDEQLIDGFQAELVLKNAPLATWSQYTPDRDPLARISGGSRNKPSALQDGSAPTVELCQGVRLFPPVAKLSQSPVVDFDASAAMLMAHRVQPIPTSNPQTVLFSSPFEPDNSPATQWGDFKTLFNGTTDGSVTDANNNTFTKAEMRGDGVTGDGMLGLLVSTLGWDKRRPAELKGGLVEPVKIRDPSDPTKEVAQRNEWELEGTPPALLADELEYYYPYLPMVTAAA